MRLFCILMLALAGCAKPIDRKALAEEILDYDPTFSTVVDRYWELAARIETYERELALKRSTVQQTVEQLRRDLANSTKTVQHKITETRVLMAPHQERISANLAAVHERLKSAQQKRSEVGKSISRLRKALEGDPETVTGSEKGQLEQLLQESEHLDAEIKEFQEQVRIYKLKQLLIQF